MRPRSRARVAVLVAMVVALVALASSAFAAGNPDLHTSVDGDVIGAGDTIQVTLQAMSATGMPSDPQIGDVRGFAIVGISPSTSSQTSIVNGTVTSRRGLTTVWTLRANKLGSFTLGPPTVVVDGRRYAGKAVSVRVVPAGQAPPRAPPSNAFDPFGGLFGQLGQIPGFNEPRRSQEPPQQAPDPRFALDAPRAAGAFLHATIDKTSAVVGEQVTYTAYLYVDTTMSRDPDLDDPHEVPASDFVKRSLMKDESHLELLGYAQIGDRLYMVELLRRLALFPLKAGELTTGMMSLHLTTPLDAVRQTENFRVHVTDPPMQGRPPGYAIGDVGKFSLAADVSGRDVDQDGAVGVTVTLSGSGNLPTTLAPPEHAGVEWLEPQVTEKVGMQPGDKFGGVRTFQYVVRMHRAGEIDLGDFTLPYWDPQVGAYDVARAPLGKVRVKAVAGAGASAQVANDVLPGLPPVRAALERPNAPRTRAHADDAPAFWLGLGAMPLAYVLVVAASDAMKRSRVRRAARGASPKTELKNRITAADDAVKGGDARAIDAATARAIEAAALAACGVNVRGLATSDVARALSDAGVAEETARAIEELLRACESARFSMGTASEESDPADVGAAGERWQRARRAIAQLQGGA